jgi:DamX protein
MVRGMTVEDNRFNTLDREDWLAELEARFGLKANPLVMDLPFFPDASRHHALETLRHLSGFGDLALVLTGDTGAGKSRLLAELVRSEASRLDFHRLPEDSLQTPQALASLLTGLAHRGLGSAESARDAVYGFFRWSQIRASKGCRMVLLIDDADHMPADVLRLLLSAYQAADRASAAALVFSGSDELVSSLGLLGDSAGVYQLHLRPLSRDDVFSYLEPRIHKAGGDVTAMLSEPRLEALHRLSQGSFTGLKRVAPAVWLDKVPVERAQTPRFEWARSARWPLLALMLLAVSWWLVSQQYEASVEREETKLQPEPIRKSVTIGPDNPLVAIRDEAEPPASTAGLTSPQESAEAAPEPEPEPAFSPVKPASFLPLEEVRALDAWTIQVIAGNQEQTVINVIEQHESALEIGYTVSRRQGADWYVGFSGRFASKEAARGALDQLPEALKRQSPWIRKLSEF